MWPGDNTLPSCWGEQFNYDPWGNLTGISPVSSAYTGCTQENWSMIPTTKNQLQDTNADYVYDAAGNLIQPGPIGGPYVFDAENHLTSAGSLVYLYDGDGKRVGKAPASTPTQPNYLYWYGTGSQILEETDGSGNYAYEDYYFNGMLLARGESDNWVDHFFADALGNTRCVYGDGDPDGGCSDYYPFGGERPIPSCCPTNPGGVNVPFMFTGKERDSESGLDNFGARYNSSQMGRFMSPDPLLNSGRPGNPQTWNRYAYALNNPLSIIDPTGLYDLVNNCATDNKKCNKQFNQHAKDLKNGLSNLQKQADKMKNGAAKDRLEASLKVLGTQGDNNGVNVNFGSLAPGVAGQKTLDMSSNSLQINSINITLDPSKINGSNDYAIDFAHEGTHAEDFLTMGLSASGVFSVPDLSPFSTEYRGYQTSAWAAQALGVSPLQYNDSNGMNVIWNSSWAAADRQVLMDRGITNHVSSIPGHPETTPHIPWPF